MNQLSVIILLAFSSLGHAATIVVDPNGGGDFAEIQPAVDAAADGDTVLLKPGEYIVQRPIDFNRLHNPRDPESPPVKNIVLRSEGPAEETVLRMSDDPVDPDRGSVVLFSKNESDASRLEGFTLTGGVDSGIQCLAGSSPVLANCTITENSAEFYGGGIYCDASAPELRGCTIAGNAAMRGGGGLHCRGGSSPTLSDCAIIGNTAFAGGGVFCSHSDPTLTGCRIARNSGTYGGGMLCEFERSPTLVECTIRDNAADTGGGVYCSNRSHLTLTSCTIVGNYAMWGGGIHSSLSRSSLTLKNCIVWGNDGGSFQSFDDFNPQITYSCIEGEAVWPGIGNINEDPLFCGWPGGSEVHVDASRTGPGTGTRDDPFSNLESALDAYSLVLLEASPCRRAGEEGTDMGAESGTCERPGAATRLVHIAAGRYRVGALSLSRDVSLRGAGEEDCIVEGSVVGLRGGAVLSDLTVTAGTVGGVSVSPGEDPDIIRCTITDNFAPENGGGVYCRHASPTLTDCTITNNKADQGGGVYCWDASPILNRCTIAWNIGDDGSGAGVHCNNASPTLIDCTITGNRITDEGDGGGLFCLDSSPTLTNCEITGNLALDYGGAVYCGGTSELTLHHCTVAGNWGELAGGIFGNSESKITVTDSIVWNNTPESIFFFESPVVEATYSCIDAEQVWPGTSNIREDPRFCLPGHWRIEVVSEFWSWREWVPGDYRLSETSPCIGTGQGGTTMGASLGTCELLRVPFQRADVNADGTLSITDAVALLSYLFRGTAEPSCQKTADADDDGELQLTDAVYTLDFLFRDGPPPKEPFPDCASDPTLDGLGCQAHPPCW